MNEEKAIVPEKRKRGRPPRKKEEVQQEVTKQEPVMPEQSVINIDVSREKVLAETILEARGYTDEELDNILLGLENQGNRYDWAQSMNEFKLPEPLQKLEDAEEQAFRWVDTSDDACMMQITRDNFRWTPVNLLSHGKYFKEREKKSRFNKHGGIMVGYMLLCWMPGKLYKRWSQIKRQMGQHEPRTDTPSKVPGVLKYDPVAEGTAMNYINTPATDKSFSGVVYEANDQHPDTISDEQGEYI